MNIILNATLLLTFINSTNIDINVVKSNISEKHNYLLAQNSKYKDNSTDDIKTLLKNLVSANKNSKINIDNDGNGYMIWAVSGNKNTTPKVYIVEINNYKLIPSSLKEDIDYYIYPEKDSKNYKFIQNSVKMENIDELSNSFTVDNNGNGNTIYFEKTQSDEYKIYIQKLKSYFPIDSIVNILNINYNSIDCNIDSKGDGYLLYTDNKPQTSNKDVLGKIYYSSVKNYTRVQDNLITDFYESNNPVVKINSDGTGLVIWQECENKLLKTYYLKFEKSLN